MDMASAVPVFPIGRMGHLRKSTVFQRSDGVTLIVLWNGLVAEMLRSLYAPAKANHLPAMRQTSHSPPKPNIAQRLSAANAIVNFIINSWDCPTSQYIYCRNLSCCKSIVETT